MADTINLNAVFGPQYEIVIKQEEIAIDKDFNLTMETKEPLRLNVGTGFNNTGSNSSSGTIDVRVTADASLGAFRAIGYNGLYVQPTLISLSQYAGISRVAVTSGSTMNVVRSGLLTESGWNWTVNSPVFITTDGMLTQSLPTGDIRRIGWAISPTELNLDPYPIIGV